MLSILQERPTPLVARTLDSPAAECDLELRLAEGPDDIDAAQALRYRVFFEEMSAIPDAVSAAARRDKDVYDGVCDHLLVVDRRLGRGPEAVVGTYRLIRREAAAIVGRFYSEAEFDIGPLLRQPGPILELGRSCVDAAYRGRATMQLLWQGIAGYVWKHGVELMFGCASLPGTDVDALAPQLAYLRAHHLAPPELRVSARAERRADPPTRAVEALDARAAFAALPPLVKGYLRVGAYVGDGAAIDRDFGTTDVCIVLRTDRVTKRYLRHYERFAPALDGSADAGSD